MKKISRKIFIIFCFLIIGVSVSACQKQPQEPKEIYYTLKYTASEGGFITGPTEQKIKKGQSGSEIIAVPQVGYEFAGWSDGAGETNKRTDQNVNANLEVQALFCTQTINIQYIAEENGKISGRADQKVPYGAKTEIVTAVPDEGYMFVRWSDGVTFSQRKDFANENIRLTAYFDVMKRSFTYDYRYATGNMGEAAVFLEYNKLDTASFPVPQRNHFMFGGWYVDEDFTIPVTNESGILNAGNEIF